MNDVIVDNIGILERLIKWQQKRLRVQDVMQTQHVLDFADPIGK